MQLYMKDSYLKEFDATVTGVSRNKDGRKVFVALDRTAFCPQGGGVPHDTGTLEAGGEYRVVFTGKFSGAISHEVDRPGLSKGDEVRGVLDWDRRYAHMRMHTAAHVLSSVIHKDTGAKITGNQITAEKTRIDFSLDELDRDAAEGWIEKANKSVSQDVELKIYGLPREEALKIPEVVKLAGAVPPNVKKLRIVEIPGIDIQADGGPHVAKTGEIGEIVFAGTKNKGKNNRRIYYTLSPPGQPGQVKQ